jgi:hypothetical protein
MKLVDGAVLGLVLEPHGLGFDGDAALALDVHLVEELRARLAFGEGAGALEDAVGQRGFSVVDVGDDGKIPDLARMNGLVARAW